MPISGINRFSFTNRYSVKKEAFYKELLLFERNLEKAFLSLFTIKFESQLRYKRRHRIKNQSKTQTFFMLFLVQKRKIEKKFSFYMLVQYFFTVELSTNCDAIRYKQVKKQDRN